MLRKQESYRYGTDPQTGEQLYDPRYQNSATSMPNPRMPEPGINERFQNLFRNRKIKPAVMPNNFVGGISQ